MGLNQSITLSSASTTPASWTALTAPASDRGRQGGAQVGVVSVSANAAISPSFKVYFALRDSTRVYKVLAATVTTPSSTITRTGTDNASGDYLGSVVFDESGNSKIDLGGQNGNLQNGAVWYVGLADAFPSGVTSVRVDIGWVYDV